MKKNHTKSLKVKLDGILVSKNITLMGKTEKYRIKFSTNFFFHTLILGKQLIKTKHNNCTKWVFFYSLIPWRDFNNYIQKIAMSSNCLLNEWCVKAKETTLTEGQ